MIGDDKDTQSRPENEARDDSSTGKSPQSSPLNVKEEGTRIGTKTDIRGSDAQNSGEESPARDKVRDGT